jgi:hypothetical protein
LDCGGRDGRVGRSPVEQERRYEMKMEKYLLLALTILVLLIIAHFFYKR